MPDLIEKLKKIVLSNDFINRHRNSPKDFTRKRALPFHMLIFFLINMNKGSYQDELDHYFMAIHQLEVAQRFVTKGSLSKARKKLSHQAFVELNEQMVHEYYQSMPSDNWMGFNLLAIDGSTLRLHDEPDIIQHFGTWNVRQGVASTKARVSQMFDVLNKITIDALITPKSEGERELAATHFLKLMPNDLVLLDRGYPAFWLFKLILSMNSHFCARISKRWKVIKKFDRSNDQQRIIKLKPSAASLANCYKMGLGKEPIRLRLIKVELDTGETEILITSLIDESGYPQNLFSDLYHKRWPVEEDYKTIKCRIHIENFSGKSALSVYQDFHAKIFSKNLTTIIVNSTKDDIKKLSEQRLCDYQINFTQALSKMKNTIVLLFIRSSEHMQRLVTKLQTIFIQTTERVRPGRKYIHKLKSNRKKFHLAYKPIR